MKEEKHNEMLCYEGFIRRASIIDMPFMLKGSYVTRQYFDNPKDRIPADLDWVYLEAIYDDQEARTLFNNWATLITELEINDGIKFVSFKENEFWRRIDYAMADDFPTVNTDLKCMVNGIELIFGLDISFNLEISMPPVPLEYRPIEGNTIIIPNTTPLALQISWKIHQTLVRPRFKDMYDLIHLVNHSSFDNYTLDQAIEALVAECKADDIDLRKLEYFFNYQIKELFENNTIDESWAYWRFGINHSNYRSNIVYDQAQEITESNKIPSSLSDFLLNFKTALQNKGLTKEIFENILQLNVLHKKEKIE